MGVTSTGETLDRPTGAVDGSKDMRLRIALTADPELPVPPRLYGGIERVVDLLATTLSARGHDVTLVAHADSTSPVRRLAWPGRGSRSKADTLRNAAFLARHVVGGSFDIVHSFSRLAYLAPLLPMPIPKLMTYQREISPRTTALAHRLSRGSLAFTAVGRHMIAPHLAGRWHFVPNGLRMADYAFRASVDEDAPLVFLGRIEAIKGPDVAIEAAHRSGRRLVLAGNIPEEHRGWFEAQVAPRLDGERVRYIGPVDDARKSLLLGRAAALLMPIAWDEPFGIVMIEAMACGTPVIGFRRGAVPEVVEDGRTGFVVDDVAGMTAAVARLLEIDRAACRDRVERFYAEAPVGDAYLTAYLAQIGAGRLRPN